MSFLYPRTISVRRPNLAAIAGDAGYMGLLSGNETVIASNLPANIQFDTHGARPLPDMPGDTQGRTMWKIFLPRSAASRGSIQKNDIIVDDLGVRYQVEAPYWNSLGHSLRVELLKG